MISPERMSVLVETLRKRREGKTYKTIAQDMGVHINTVMQRIKQAEKVEKIMYQWREDATNKNNRGSLRTRFVSLFGRKR